MTIKLLAEWPLEKQYLYAAEDEDRSLEAAIDFMWDVCQQDLIDFMYKSSYCQLAILVATELGTGNAPDLADSLPANPLILNLTGWDEEEIKIREEIVEEIAEKVDMFLIDIESMLPGEDVVAREQGRAPGDELPEPVAEPGHGPGEGPGQHLHHAPADPGDEQPDPRAPAVAGGGQHPQ